MTGGTEEGDRRGAPVLWVASIALLLGISLWLTFSSGGYLARQWLPPILVLASFGLVVAILIAYPRRPRQLSLAVLGLTGAYSVWVGASTVWAASSSGAWLESARTFGYLLVLALALTYFTASSARTAFRYLLLTAAFILLAVCVWRLWSTADLPSLFLSKRLSYPARHPNDSAAIFLISFWPLMWLASAPNERAPIRGLSLGLATGLLGLAVLTQSRGAVWSMAISMLVMFLLSPARLRLLFYLVVPALLMAYEFPQLNKYWVQSPEALTGGPAARTLAVAAIAAASIGVILSLLEKWVRVSGRMKVIFGTVVLVGCVAGLVYGAVARPTMTPPAGPGRSLLADTSMADRVAVWKVAWNEFKAAPWLGAGADDPGEPGQARSLTLQVLEDTGIVGGVLAFSGILLAITGILWPRLAVGWERARRGRLSRWGADPMVYGWEMALLGGVAYWFVHANVEHLWQVAGVTIPALLMLAAAMASVDARAGTMWPRIVRSADGDRQGAPPVPCRGSSASG